MSMGRGRCHPLPDILSRRVMYEIFWPMYAMIFGFVALAAYEAEWIRRLQKRHGECRSNLEDTIRLLKDQLRSVGAAPPDQLLS
jgi:hypothetical protein